VSNFDFPDWFFKAADLRIPVVATHLLPYQERERDGMVHWRLLDGTLYMSWEAFDELKRIADAGPEERSVVA
jgi:hypothetical protein